MIQDPKFKQNTCRLDIGWKYRDMDVVWLENDWLRIGILPGRGGDIFEFIYKPMAMDFLLRLKKGIVNPRQVFSQMRDTENQFEDYYYGGWQEILPATPAFRYRGASIGQHGEVSLIPWEFKVIKNTPQSASLKLWTRPIRIPLLIEKTLEINNYSAELIINETLINESRTFLDIAWGHHIAFGLPFLKDGVLIDTNANTITIDSNMPNPRRFKPNSIGKWPMVESMTGIMDNASIVPPESDPPYCDLAYLEEFEKNAYYTIYNPEKDLGFALNWDAEIFGSLWYWQERYATQDFPWWGDCYTVALEPWTTKQSDEPEVAIERGDWLRINPGQQISTKLTAQAFEGNFRPSV